MKRMKEVSMYRVGYKNYYTPYFGSYQEAYEFLKVEKPEVERSLTHENRMTREIGEHYTFQDVLEMYNTAVSR